LIETNGGGGEGKGYGMKEEGVRRRMVYRSVSAMHEKRRQREKWKRCFFVLYVFVFLFCFVCCVRFAHCF
jgi:hypothetical protein